MLDRLFAAEVLGVVDDLGLVRTGKFGVGRMLIRDDGRSPVHPLPDKGQDVPLGLLLDDRRQGPGRLVQPVGLPEHEDAALLLLGALPSGLLPLRLLRIRNPVDLSDGTHDVSTVDLDHAPHLRLRPALQQRPTQLVQENEGRLVLNIDLPRQLKGAQSLDCVDIGEDSQNQLAQGQLHAMQDGAAGQGEYGAAVLALPLPASAIRVQIHASASRAERAAVGHRPA